MKKQIPPFRCLRGYAFDPSMSLELDTVGINEITYKIPWEQDLQPGPEGEYVKIVDRDPASAAFYKPVDLNEKEILANDGLDPSESNPQFHQQMVYAVTMNTIKNFEKAIGRKVQWSSKKVNAGNKSRDFLHEYVDKLVIYPHAVREANAYYSAERKALLFGYFNATPASDDLHMPGSIVFSCLSHDIIAHETTHAILDGMFSRYMEPTHPDVAAFHEGFADIVALFQHFTFTDVLKHQLAKTRGSFDAENLLGQLAVEFGKASGEHGSLRDAIGQLDKNNKWVRAKPRLNAYREEFECHDRGSILVAAVFDAFISIYNQRSADLIRIATGGSGVLPQGEINTDLINRLAIEASKTASHILNMCIRALDYCPPVDITYGDYLRAIITADAELLADDNRNYRIAFIDAFRKRGIYPEGITNLSVETLAYTAEEQPDDFEKFAGTLNKFLRSFKNAMAYKTNREEIFNDTKKFISFKETEIDGQKITGLHEYIFQEAINKKENNFLFEKLTGLVFSGKYADLKIRRSSKGGPAIEIHDIRLNTRVSPNGSVQNQAIITLGQRCGVKVVHDEEADDYDISLFELGKGKENEDGCFIFRGGCTLIFDLNTLKLKHVISKPLIDMSNLSVRNKKYELNKNRVVMQYRSTFGDYAELTGLKGMRNMVEPFAHIHKHKPIEA